MTTETADEWSERHWRNGDGDFTDPTLIWLERRLERKADDNEPDNDST